MHASVGVDEGQILALLGSKTGSLLWQNLAIDWRNWIERSRYRGVNGEVA